MNDVFQKIINYLTIKRVSSASILLNIISIVFGIIYIACLTVGINYVLIVWDIFGALIIVTIFSNILLIYLDIIKLNKTSKQGNRLNILGIIYLIFIIFATFLIYSSHDGLTNTYKYTFESTYQHYLGIFGGYFGILAFGLIFSWLNFKNIDNNELWDLQIKVKDNVNHSKKVILLKRIVKTSLGVFLFMIVVILGIMCGLNLVLGFMFGTQPPEVYGYEMTPLFMFGFANHSISSRFNKPAIFFSLFLICSTIILLTMINKKKHRNFYNAIGLIGLTVSGMMILPIMLTPVAVYSAEQNFAAAFGADWREKIPDDIEREYFLQTPFSTPGYFLSVPPKDVSLETDILYYEDDDIKLRFDFYEFDGDSYSRPGKNTVMIRIHGGAWTLGDKGSRIQVNKYFAYQGYKVFDIQYGLKEMDFHEFMSVPDDVLGDFSINDMINHTGIFTEYLKSHNDRFDIDLKKGVVITGGSAGGHLTSAMALAIDTGDYTDYFGGNITIKGFAPLYPANRIPLKEIGGSYDFCDPARMVEKNSPPCLIWQGTSDGLVHYSIPIDFKDAYMEANNDHCAIIWGPLATHGGDDHYTGYSSQVWIYYQERFLYLCVNDLIE